MVAPRIRECMKCWGQPTRATVRLNVCVDEDRYPLDLCEEHAEMAHRDLARWTNTLADPTEHKPPIRFGERTERVKPIAIPAVVRELEPEPEPVAAMPIPLFREPLLPPGAEEWNVTAHANDQRQRADRNISEADMYWAAIKWDYEFPDDKEPGVAERIRNGVGVVVNYDQKIIISVYRSSRTGLYVNSRKGV